MVHQFTSGRRQFNSNSLLIIIAFLFGSMSHGYASSVIALILAQPTFLSYFDFDTRSDGTSLGSTFNGLVQTGGFLGVFFVIWIADKYGRQFGIAVPVVILVDTAALMAESTNVGEFVVWRFFAGAGTFMILAAVPIYMTEAVAPRNRGMLVDIHGAALLFEYMCVIWVGYAIYFWSSENNWRLLFDE